jgi:hypothetical protein
MALYAFGGGGSGAAMRLRGLPNSNEETPWLAIGGSGDARFTAIATVAQEIIATQHGTDADLQGAGWLFLVAGNSRAPSCPCVAAFITSEPARAE